MNVDEKIYLNEFYGNSGTQGHLFSYLTNYLNNHRVYGNLLQRNDLMPNNKSAPGNKLLIDQMRSSPG